MGCSIGRSAVISYKGREVTLPTFIGTLICPTFYCSRTDFFGFSEFKWGILSVFLLITASKLATLVPVYHKIAALELANLTTALLVNENFNVDLPEDDLDT